MNHTSPECRRFWAVPRVYFSRSGPGTTPRPPIARVDAAADASVGADHAPTAALPPVAAAIPAAGGTSASGRGDRCEERWPELATRWTAGADAGSGGLAIDQARQVLAPASHGLTRFCPSLICHISPAPRVARVRAPHARRRASVAVPARAHDERRRAKCRARGGPRRRSGARRRRSAVVPRPAAPEDAPVLRADPTGDRGGAEDAGTFRRGRARPRSRETRRRSARSRRIRLILGPFDGARSRRRGGRGAASSGIAAARSATSRVPPATSRSAGSRGIAPSSSTPT